MYCRPLTFDFHIDTADLEYLQNTVDLSKIKNFTQFKSPGLSSSKFKDFLMPLGIKIYFYEIFYTAPKSTIPIHNDGVETIVKINWVFGANDSTMQWWEVKDENHTPTFHITEIGTECEVFDVQKCTCVYKEKIISPSLVNVRQLHSIDNSTNEGRWCMSFALYDIDKKQPLTWDDAVSKLNKFMK